MAAPIAALLGRLLFSGGRGLSALGRASSRGAAASLRRGRSGGGGGGSGDDESSRMTIGEFSKLIVLATTGLIGIVTASKKLSERLNASNESLRRFDGRIAMAFAKLEFGNLLREQHLAGATSGSASTLADSVNAMKNELAPLREGMSTIINIVGIGLADLVSASVQILRWMPLTGAIADTLKEIERRMGGGANQMPPWVSALDDWANMQRNQPQRRRPPQP